MAELKIFKDKVNNMVIFQNKEYITRQIALHGFGDVLISTASLNTALMTENGSYASTEARYVDEMICYFVEDNEILLSDKILTGLIKKGLY